MKNEIKRINRRVFDAKLQHQIFPNEDLIERICSRYGFAKTRFKETVCLLLINMNKDKMVSISLRDAQELIVMLEISKRPLQAQAKLSFGKRKKHVLETIKYVDDFILRMKNSIKEIGE
jgi:hypothetical protein